MVVIPEEASIDLTLVNPKHRMSEDFSNRKLEIQNDDEFITISQTKTLVIETEEKKNVEEINEEKWHTMSL